MKTLRSSLCVVLLFLLALPAAAAIAPNILQTDDHGCAGNMSTDGCFSDPTPTAWVGGDYIACTAKGGSANQGSYHLSLIEVVVSGKLVKKWACGKFEADGACSCNADTQKTKGLCTFYR